MTVLERSIPIQATPDEIDEITLDGSRFPEWYAGVQEAVPDDIYPQPGGVVDVVYKAAGLNFNMTMTALELVKGQKLTLKMDGMITGTSDWSYAVEGDTTRVHCTFEYEIPGGGMGKALNKLIVERMNSENLEKSLANLKALVEGK